MHSGHPRHCCDLRQVCGKLRSNYKQLHLHMVQRHKQPAPPLAKLLPASALATLTAAAAGAGAPAAATNSTSSTKSSIGQQQRQPPAQPGNKAAAAAASNWSWSVADPWAMRNSSTRTVGRVERYCNSQGHQFIPPHGHQISLKYVLLREGAEVRTVQRQARAVDAAVADSLHKFLHKQLLQRPAAEVQGTHDVLAVVSDKGAHTLVLQQARKYGIQSIAICAKMKRFKGADVTLRWQWLVSGRYNCSAVTQG